MKEEKKDDRATMKVPLSVRQKVAVLAAALGVPIYQVIDDMASQKLKEMGISIKEQNVMTQREVIDAIGALAEVVEANREIPGAESIVAEANEKIRELIPLVSGTAEEVREGLAEELASKYPYSLQQINSLLKDAVVVLKDSFSEELIVEMLDMCKAHSMSLNRTKHAMLRDLRRRENHGNL